MKQSIPKVILDFFKKCLSIFSKPQRRQFLTYLVGLIFLIRFRSIKEISVQFGAKIVDSLHHFIRNAPWRTEALYQVNQQQIVEKEAQHHKMRKIAILDDTSCRRKGKKIEGLGVHYGANGMIRGLCAVTSLVIIGSIRFIWAIKGYRPKKSCQNKEEFKSKVTLALEMLKGMVSLGPGLTVLMDAWYACAPILNFILKQVGWTFLCAIKQNRIVFVNGRKTRVSHLAKGQKKYKKVHLPKKRRFCIAKMVVILPRVGKVLLFISKSSHGTRFFITNELSMSEDEMVKLYTKRYWIDTMHQEIKNHLGFGEIFMRSWIGVQKHWALVAIAYNSIVLWNKNLGARRYKTFGQAIKAFRKHVLYQHIIELSQKSILTA